MQMVMGCCTNIYVLDSGELIANGTPAEISSNELVIEAYLGKRRGR
jgi:branched-chain amino acid transport system ATP-binding protein